MGSVEVDRGRKDECGAEDQGVDHENKSRERVNEEMRHDEEVVHHSTVSENDHTESF